MRRPPWSAVGAAAAAGLLLLVAACGASTTPGATATAAAQAGGPVSVVASTNVYGSIAEAVGGDAVRVTSIIAEPQQDPHSYEGNTQVALQLSKASLVVENGGGYDDFVDKLLGASDQRPVVLNAVAVSGFTAAPGAELNEHVWYSFPTVQRVARQIAVELGRIDPAHAAVFTANANHFAAQVDSLIAAEAMLKGRYAGVGVGITEPVPLYLLDAIGLQNRTPAEFSEAVEEGEDVSAAVLQETRDLYRDHQVKALVYNSQTSGPVTEQVKAAAEAAGIPVVPVTETLPVGQTYLSWMRANVSAVGQALGR